MSPCVWELDQQSSLPLRSRPIGEVLHPSSCPSMLVPVQVPSWNLHGVNNQSPHQVVTRLAASRGGVALQWHWTTITSAPCPLHWYRQSRLPASGVGWLVEGNRRLAHSRCRSQIDSPMVCVGGFSQSHPFLSPLRHPKTVYRRAVADGATQSSSESGGAAPQRRQATNSA